jgi:hypothetical protein
MSREPIGFGAPPRPAPRAAQPEPDTPLPRPTNPLFGHMSLSRLVRSTRQLSDVERMRMLGKP